MTHRPHGVASRSWRQSERVPDEGMCAPAAARRDARRDSFEETLSREDHSSLGPSLRRVASRRVASGPAIEWQRDGGGRGHGFGRVASKRKDRGRYGECGRASETLWVQGGGRSDGRVPAGGRAENGGWKSLARSLVRFPPPSPPPAHAVDPGSAIIANPALLRDPQGRCRPCQTTAERHARTALATGSCHSWIVRENVAARSGIANHGETETAGETGEGEASEKEKRGERGKEKEGERERERERDRRSRACMHTRGHCDGGGGGGGGDGWAVLRRGRWRKAIKRFCCGPRFFPSSALSSRLSTSPAHRLSLLPRRPRYAAKRALERKPGSLSPPLPESARRYPSNRGHHF
ncbi:hypothetical protein ALC62_05609 [Cyphomyrmex costatus]|uniref:Uncharacterized protein n=1 Tax=Cyphomyrmex costatus TaxID=456900 RepID=A0A195CSI1_9HYME|nr:hypothetical protein ALC62_05609 [Cyphomyrmex costatus]